MKIILSMLCVCTSASAQSFLVTERVSTFSVSERDEERYYTVMWTAKWCGPCQSFKNSGKLDKLKELCPVTVVDIDENPEWKKKIRVLPTFWLARRSDRKMVKEWTGSVDVSQIADELKTIRLKQTVRVSSANLLFGRHGTSHESRSTLIEHLSFDGIHRGKHVIARLYEMSDSELNDLHQKDHGWNN